MRITKSLTIKKPQSSDPQRLIGQQSSHWITSSCFILLGLLRSCLEDYAKINDARLALPEPLYVKYNACIPSGIVISAE